MGSVASRNHLRGHFLGCVSIRVRTNRASSCSATHTMPCTPSAVPSTSPREDQGDYTCLAFTTTSSLEDVSFIAIGTLSPLNEKQLVDRDIDFLPVQVSSWTTALLSPTSVMCLETQYFDFDIYSTLSICPNSVWCDLILASFYNGHLTSLTLMVRV